MRVEGLKKKEKHLYNFTGLRMKQFEELVEEVQRTIMTNKYEFIKPRQRAMGGGRKPDLSIEDQVLVILMYYRLYVTQILLGYLFDLDDSNISRLINKLRPVLLEVLPLPAQETTLFAQEAGQKRISSLEELLEKYPEIKEVLIDATEQENQKPKDKKKRKENYSGKQKRHTLKSQITSSKTGHILHLTDSLPGKVSDIIVLRGTGVLRDLPDDIAVRLDKGYDGIQNDYPDRQFYQPAKARRNKPLDFIQRCRNRIQNRICK